MNSKLAFNLADLFENVADHVPERDAVVCGDRRLTFAQLDERANRLAHHLAANGVKRGDHVGLYLYNSSEYLEGALAAFKLRAVPVNINFRYVEDELRYLFADADLVALVYSREFAPRVAAVLGEAGSSSPPLPLRERGPGGEGSNQTAALALKTFVYVDDGSDAPAPIGDEYEAALAAASPVRDFGERSGDDLYLIYTGGTTGMPKGVMWRQEDVFFAGLQGGNPGGADITEPGQIGPNARERTNAHTTLPVAPLMHGNGHWAAMIGLHGGGKVVLATGRKLDPHEIWTLVEREKVQVMSIVGDAMARPLAEALHAPDAAYDTSPLLVMSSGGAIFSEAVKDQLRAKLPHTLLIDAFGVSEAGHQGMNLGANGGGRPRFSVEGFTAVLDDEMRRIEPGSEQVGRLARCGRLPLGYYKDPEKTARTFVTDASGTRWVLPGDMATIDADGIVTLLGRGSICINSGGEKIYPEEVEAALKAHAAVFDAVVVGVPDERWGERVAAVVQPRPGTTPTLDDLVAHCRTKVSGYKVPRELHLVEEMQRSPSGKADYRWARAVATGDGGGK